MGIVLDFLFPKKCAGCGKNSSYICQKCRKQIKSQEVDYTQKKIEGKIGLFKYDGVVRELIQTIKFEFVSEAIAETGFWVATVLKKEYPNIVTYWREEKYVIMPVPLHWRRENWRGFNQSVQLAKVIGKKLKIPVGLDLVIRVKQTKSQAIQPKDQKGPNVKKAFGAVGKIPPKIIIFDDVWTSGATIKSLIKVLPKKTKIWVLTLASGR